MKPIAPGIFQFRFLWPNTFNVYYIESATECIVIDAAIRWSWPMMRSQLKNKKVDGVVLTHAHPDHQGCAANICRTFNAPLIVHQADSDSAAGKARLVRQSAFLETLGNIVWAGKRTPVGRILLQGDTIAGFEVHHMPGHTPGQITLFRRSDRIAIAGDVINTNDYLSGIFTMVREPPRIFSLDPEENRRSMRKLLELNPSLILPGHGPPLLDINRLERLITRLGL